MKSPVIALQPNDFVQIMQEDLRLREENEILTKKGMEALNRTGEYRFMYSDPLVHCCIYQMNLKQKARPDHMTLP